MKLSELIEKLSSIHSSNGDLEVCYESVDSYIGSELLDIQSVSINHMDRVVLSFYKY